MTVSELVEGLDCEIIGDGESVVTAIAYDSRTITKSGTLFAAINGLDSNGFDFIPEAVKRGALSVLAERESSDLSTACQVIAPDVRATLARISERFYLSPAEKLTLVGITGTNGKTTTAYLIEAILKEAGFVTGVMGTINYRYGLNSVPAPRTTPEAPDISKLLSEMLAAGVTHSVMEVSSHALTQKRADGCRFSVALFTNLTHEHLDYHLTMEDYFLSKERLFKELLKDGASAVINIDDPYGERLAKEIAQVLTYSLDKDKGADIFPITSDISASGIRAIVASPLGELEINSPLAGEYNLSNLLAALGVAAALGVDARAAVDGLAALKRVPGRIERVVVEGVETPFETYVDYAHTADALGRVAAALKAITPEGSRLITLFGCGGDRDREKRPEMGSVATKHSDITIITSDNPRTEEALEIIADIEAGIEGVERIEPGSEIVESGYMVVADRGEAIDKAVQMARPGDTLLLAGKGHEDYQIVGREKRHFDDMEEAARAIKNLYAAPTARPEA